MITTDFAPNESWDDALISLKLIFQPWKWKWGVEIAKAKKNIGSQFQILNSNNQVFFFLSGRSALFTILQLLALPKNSDILVQSFTCEAVILPIIACGHKPVYVDIETRTLSMNPIDLEKKISGKSKVLVLQHTFGMTPVQKAKILDLVKRYKLVLIEDIAHGYSIEQILNSKFEISNQMFLLSFGRSKALSSVFGSAVVTANNVYIKKLAHFERKLMPSSFFILRLLLYKPISWLIKIFYDFYIGKLVHKAINYCNILVPEISQKEKKAVFDQSLDKAYPNALAALLNHQLAKFEQTKNNRASICSYYSKNLLNQGFITDSLPLIRYPYLIKQPQKLLFKASKQNIFLGKWYDQVVAPKSLDLKKVGYIKGSCPKAEKICQLIINLPTNIKIGEANKIINIVEDKNI